MSHLKQLILSGNLINWAISSDQNTNFLQETQTVGATEIKLLAPGILSIEPSEASTDALILSCGVHGNETAPIELCESLFKQVIEGSLTLNCRLLLIFGNLPAMRTDVRFCDENLNRLFKKELPGQVNLETVRAQEIMSHVDNFYQDDDQLRIHLDLHTAIRGSKYKKFAIYPFKPDGHWHQGTIKWLINADIEAILLAHKPSGTFSCFTGLHYQAHGYTVELGKAKPFGTNDHDSLKQFKQSLQKLLTNPGLMVNPEVSSDDKKGVIFQVVDEVLRHNDNGFKLNLTPDFKNFSVVEKGTQLTEDGDQGYMIKADNQAIVFPNDKVPVGQRVALVIEPQ